MKKSTKTILTVAAIAAGVTAVITAVSKYFCDFAIGKGKHCFNVKGGYKVDSDVTDDEQQRVINLLHDRQTKYREWFLQKAENIYLLTNDGVKVHALLASQNTNKYVIICHGYRDNAEDMGYQAYNFYEMGYNVLSVDGRAMGGTAGKYIGMGWLERKDLCGYINFILSRNAHAQIVLYGVSMGAAEVMMATGEKLPDNVKAIIEDCGYTSVWDEFVVHIKSIFNLPAFPILNFASIYSKIFVGYGFKEASAIKALQTSTIPILMIHGTDDDLVPYEMLDKLYDAAAGEKEMLTINGAKHIQSDIVAPELYWAKVKSFTEKYIK